MTGTLTAAERDGGGPAVVPQQVGNALVLHLGGPLSEAAQTLAVSVPPDPDDDVVVLDLPPDVPFASWQTVTRTMPRRRRRGVRLVPADPAYPAAAFVAHWLAQRLRCPVYAPDGRLARTAAGHLFVVNGGWLRFVPGREPVPAGRRYPAPVWDGVADALRPLRDTVAAEPLPSGVWIRDARDPAPLDAHRTLLTAAAPCDPDTITVVLGCPGTAPVTGADVAAFAEALPIAERMRLRFAPYGPVEAPEGDPVGQAVADALDVNVVCYAGLPLTSPYLDATHTVRADGTIGWPTLARELGFAPRVLPISLPKPPVVLGHRTPPGLGEEAGPQLYRYADGVLVEVVPAGLWVRGADEPAHADAVRSLLADPERCTVVADDGPEMRTAAATLAERLAAAGMAATVRGAADVVPAPDTLPGPFAFRPAPPPREPEAEDEAPPADRPAPRADADRTVAPGGEAEPTAPPVSAPSVPDPVQSGPVRAASAPAAAPVWPLPHAAPTEPVRPAPPAVPAPAAPDAEHAIPMPVPSAAAEPLPEPPLTARTSQPGGPRSAAHAIPAPQTARPIHPPATPPLPPWLHAALSALDPAAPALASPGEPPETVALRWYLSPAGATLDAHLRRGADGPIAALADHVEAALTARPAYRGPVGFTLSPTPRQWQLYGTRQAIVDWGFVHARTTPGAPADGDTDVLLLSLTARPAGDGVPERVLFLPGTVFRLLELTPPAGGRRGRILLRELHADEVRPDGTVDTRYADRDTRAAGELRAWSRTPPGPPAPAGRPAHLPGLV